MTPLEASLRAQLDEAREQIEDLKREARLMIKKDAVICFRAKFKLTTSEASLLAQLYSAHGRVIPHGNLFDAMYDGRGDTPESDTAIIKVYTCKIRRKIGREAIDTMWGAGYALSPVGIKMCDEALAA